MSNMGLLLCTHCGDTHHQHTDQQTGAAALCVSKVAEQQCARGARDVPDEKDTPEAEGLHGRCNMMSVGDYPNACQHHSISLQAVIEGSGASSRLPSCLL